MTEPRSRVALESEATAKVVTRPEARIDVSAQLISMEPGLYAVSVVAPALARTEGGMVLPCIRMDPLPDQDRVRAFFASLADSSLLVPSATPAYLHIVGGRASILLTTYKASGPMPPPDIHIRMVEPVPVAALEHGPGGSEKVDGQSGDALASASLRLLVHLQNHGDVVFPGGVWAMAPDGDGSVEGFCISGSDELPPGSLEYQAVLGSDWVSPWMEQGEFCGSRQMALPLLEGIASVVR
jgi:hypothetical protein